jgi:hypothetical protein
VRARVNTQGAKVTPKPKAAGAGRFVLRFIGSALRARVDGSYKTTPFYRANGTSMSAPRVLTAAERAQVMQAVETGVVEKIST